jgi:heme/copper-type cytochrome/quinol oxidase subunit 4
MTALAQLLRGRITAVWGVLIALTLLSWWMGTDHGVGDAQTASVLVLLVAFLKVRFVGLYFMELRSAPLPLRALFEGWCTVVAATVIAMYVAL